MIYLLNTSSFFVLFYLKSFSIEVGLTPNLKLLDYLSRIYDTAVVKSNSLFMQLYQELVRCIQYYFESFYLTATVSAYLVNLGLLNNLVLCNGLFKSVCFFFLYKLSGFVIHNIFIVCAKLYESLYIMKSDLEFC